MIWMWERRWGLRVRSLPGYLRHHSCGKAFLPVLACTACSEKAGMNDLSFSLQPVPELLLAEDLSRNARVTSASTQSMGQGLRVDRWSLLIVTAVVLGCHYFDELSRVLGIASSVLARRLSGMVETGLLLAQPDVADARRMRYRLTPASRDLFGYLVCFSTWASRDYLQQPSSIRPVHKDCGHRFVPKVLCSACRAPVLPWDVSFSDAPD
jgi:DNA-binding HxlR family transcriptional regulator